MHAPTRPDPTASHREEHLLTWVFALTASYALVELVGGYLANALTLIADSGHMLLDASAVGLAWWAVRLTRRPAQKSLTYGYHRYQVLVAFVNGLAMFALCGWLLFKAAERIGQPQQVLPIPALAVAVIGLAINLLAIRLLWSSNSLTIRSAALHLIGDILGSLAAVLSAALIWAFGWLIADPLLTLLVVAILVRSAWRILREAALILLEGAPAHLDRDEMQQTICDCVDAVRDVHHLHLWALNDRHPLLTLHARVETPEQIPATTEQIKALLLDRFGIEHSTVQVECGPCPDEPETPAPTPDRKT